MLTICNEPVKPLLQMRSPRIWQSIFTPDLAGKIALSEIQLNHALASEEFQDLDNRLMALYAAVVHAFAKAHGESTRCFLARAPESLCLVGHHIKEFGGSTNGIAYLETLMCVSPRSDGRVSISHVDPRFAPVEFDLLAGLPKARVLNWGEFVRGGPGTGTTKDARGADDTNAWWAPLKHALQYYVNRHKGPTGQIELNIPGLNVVVGALLPGGEQEHSLTTLTAATLAAIMAASGEWGRLPLAEFVEWLDEAQSGAAGRKSDPGALVFGMPGEVTHLDWKPARAKSKALPHGFSFLTASTGMQAASPKQNAIPAGSLREVDILKTPAARVTTTAAGIELLRQVARFENLPLTDEAIYRMLREVPVRATRDDMMRVIKSENARIGLQERFKTHAEPAGGYNLREKLLFVLGEMRRADRATSAIRAADPAALGMLMNIGQAGEANYFHDVAPMGLSRETYAIPSCDSDQELFARAADNNALWRETGRSGASTIETDLLCDIASVIPGVLGARYCEPGRVAILCKSEVVQLVKDALINGYYTPRGLPVSCVEQIFPCQGVGIFAV